MKQVLLMIAVVVLVGCGTTSAPTTLDMPAMKALAEAGDANAQYNLGVMYATGKGVEQDFKEAFKWWQKAADQGFDPFCNQLIQYCGRHGLKASFGKNHHFWSNSSFFYF